MRADGLPGRDARMTCGDARGPQARRVRPGSIEPVRAGSGKAGGAGRMNPAAAAGRTGFDGSGRPGAQPCGANDAGYLPDRILSESGRWLVHSALAT